MSTRPFTTYYFHSRSDAEKEEYSRIGRAGSEVGALRAAIVRVFLGQYTQATVYLNMVPVMTIAKVRGGISVGYGRSVGSKLSTGTVDTVPDLAVRALAPAAGAAMH